VPPEVIAEARRLARRNPRTGEERSPPAQVGPKLASATAWSGFPSGSFRPRRVPAEISP
jgi:hypothetical protein